MNGSNRIGIKSERKDGGEEKYAAKKPRRDTREAPAKQERSLVAAAPASPPAPPRAQQQQQQQQSDDEDVEISKENSAWDALEERFEQAAANGLYLDLTQDDDDDVEGGAKPLSAETARQDFSKASFPQDPSTMVHDSTTLPSAAAALTTTTTTRKDEEPEELQELWMLISDTIRALEAARGDLQRACSGGQDRLRKDMLKRNHDHVAHINKRVKRIQSFVKKYPTVTTDSARAVRRIEELNLLVHKANIFINKFNTERILETLK